MTDIAPQLRQAVDLVEELEYENTRLKKAYEAISAEVLDKRSETAKMARDLIEYENTIYKLVERNKVLEQPSQERIYQETIKLLRDEIECGEEDYSTLENRFDALDELLYKEQRKCAELERYNAFFVKCMDIKNG